MTKQDFVNAVAERAGLSNRDAGAIVDAFLDVITETLRRGDSVTFTGFGKFSTSARASRMGVNPRTGAKAMIPATTVPKFSAGSAMKSAVRAYGPRVDSEGEPDEPWEPGTPPRG